MTRIRMVTLRGPGYTINIDVNTDGDAGHSCIYDVVHTRSQRRVIKL